VFEPVRRRDESSSESPRPASFAIESPTWVWALTNAGQTMSDDAVPASSIAVISPSSTTTRPSVGS